jgi:hypothetical protein
MKTVLNDIYTGKTTMETTEALTKLQFPAPMRTASSTGLRI